MPLVSSLKSCFFNAFHLLISTQLIIKYMRWKDDDSVRYFLRMRDDVMDREDEVLDDEIPYDDANVLDNICEWRMASRTHLEL